MELPGEIRELIYAETARQRFFDLPRSKLGIPPAAFAAVLRETDSVLTGSLALHCVSPVFEPHDVDIVTADGREVTASLARHGVPYFVIQRHHRVIILQSPLYDIIEIWPEPARQIPPTTPAKHVNSTFDLTCCMFTFDGREFRGPDTAAFRRVVEHASAEVRLENILGDYWPRPINCSPVGAERACTELGYLPLAAVIPQVNTDEELRWVDLDPPPPCICRSDGWPTVCLVCILRRAARRTLRWRTATRLVRRIFKYEERGFTITGADAALDMALVRRFFPAWNAEVDDWPFAARVADAVCLSTLDGLDSIRYTPLLAKHRAHMLAHPYSVKTPAEREEISQIIRAHATDGVTNPAGRYFSGGINAGAFEQHLGHYVRTGTI